MPNANNHDKWCREQHHYIRVHIGKINTKLGKIETRQESQGKDIAEHKDCAAKVHVQLVGLNERAAKRDGVVKTLMWTAGLGIPTLIATVALVWRIAS